MSYGIGCYNVYGPVDLDLEFIHSLAFYLLAPNLALDFDLNSTEQLMYLYFRNANILLYNHLSCICL